MDAVLGILVLVAFGFAAGSLLYVLDHCRRVAGTSRRMLVTWPQIQSTLLTLGILAFAGVAGAGVMWIACTVAQGIADGAASISSAWMESVQDDAAAQPDEERVHVIRFNDDEATALGPSTSRLLWSGIPSRPYRECFYLDGDRRLHIDSRRLTAQLDERGWDVYSCGLDAR